MALGTPATRAYSFLEMGLHHFLPPCGIPIVSGWMLAHHPPSVLWVGYGEGAGSSSWVAVQQKTIVSVYYFSRCPISQLQIDEGVREKGK